MSIYNLRELLNSRILILDGAMGTEIQKLNLNEDDFRGNLFKNYNKEEIRSILSLFASTSPSYLILQSLDLTNLYIAEDYKLRLEKALFL